MKKIIFDIYFFLKERKKNNKIKVQKIFSFLKESQYWSTNKLEAYQLQQLNTLCSNAKNYTKFYSKLYNKINFPLKEINSFKKNIPMIKKSDLIIGKELLKNENSVNSFRHTTSGSSGDPLSVSISQLSEAYRKAGRMRFYDWWGIKKYEKSVLIWRFDRYEGKNIIKKIKEYFKQRYNLNVYSLNDETIKKHYKNIEKFKPTYLRGYSSGVVEFAKLLKKHNLSFKNVKFKVAITTAENLFEHDRKLIEEVLKCKVANEYGSAEAGLFAYECPQGSMHIYEEANYIYTGKENEVYVTELYNDSTPIINYRNDDVINISNSKCKCGRNLRVIDSLYGRESGYILKSDGTKINQGKLIDIFIDLQENGFVNAIRKFRVVQRKTLLEVYLVPLDNYTKEVEHYLQKQIHSLIDKNLEVKFYLQKEIEREKAVSSDILIG